LGNSNEETDEFARFEPGKYFFLKRQFVEACCIIAELDRQACHIIAAGAAGRKFPPPTFNQLIGRLR
jgi:hypothetical protein